MIRFYKYLVSVQTLGNNNQNHQLMWVNSQFNLIPIVTYFLSINQLVCTLCFDSLEDSLSVEGT